MERPSKDGGRVERIAGYAPIQSNIGTYRGQIATRLGRHVLIGVHSTDSRARTAECPQVLFHRLNSHRLHGLMQQNILLLKL